MSSTGTRPVRTVQSRSNEALIEADKELINSLKIFSEASNFVAGLTGTPAQNSPKTPAGNYLAREGDSMIGPLALGPPLDFDIEVDADNTIDIGSLNDNAQFTSNVQLDDLQPNSSVLDIISNAAFDGQILVLRTFAPTVDYTISQGTLGNGGNIQTGDGSDLTVGDLQTITFIFDESLKIESNTGGSWRVLSVSSGGGGSGLSEPVILTVNTITPETLPTTSVIDWSKNPNHITLDRDVEFSFSNLPASGSYEGVLVIIDVDGTGGYASPVWPGAVTNPPTVSTVANTRTSVMLYTINGGTVVTHATSVGSSSGGGSVSQWATFAAVADIDYGTFDGINIDRLIFDQAAGSSLLSTSTGITSDAASSLIQNVPSGSQFIFTVAGGVAPAALVINATTLTSQTIVPAGTDDVGLSGARWNNVFAINVDATNVINSIIASSSTLAGTLVSTGLSYNDGVKQTFNPNATNAGLNVGAHTADPSSPVDGDIIYNSTANNFRFRENGVWAELGGVPSSIIDGNTSFTAEGTADTLTGTFNGNADRLLVFGQGTARYEMQAANYTSTYFRNDATGVGGNFIHLEIHRGVDDQGTSSTFNYYQTISSILDPTNGSEDGKWLESIGAKGSEVTAYTLEGSTGLINTNVLHSFFGSMILKSNQNGDDAILRLSRNDTTPNDDDVLGTIQFRGEDSAGNDTEYGSISVEASDVSNLSENGRFAVDLINGAVTERMIVADSLTNEIKFAPTSAFDYIFDTTGLSMINVDASPNVNDVLPPLIFSVNDSGVITEYAQISATILEVTDAAALTFSVRADNGLISAMVIQGDDNNQRFQFLLSGTTQARIQPVFDRMGYFVTPQVTDFSLVLGTGGSLEIPRVADGSPSLTDLNQAFGAFDGAFGYESVDERLYVRESSSRWVFFSAAGAVT